MIIGVPKEIKANENRVAITPAGVTNFVRNGHEVFIEKNAGLGSGFTDEEFIEEGAKILGTPDEIYDRADMILKVKEPLPSEYDLLKPGQILFTYLHLASDKKMTEALLEANIIGIAYETVQLPNGFLPLLTPMSEIAGRMSVQIGAHFLEKPHGGKGVLLSGAPGVLPAKVTVVGGGNVGANAARIAAGLGADVTIVELSPTRLRALEDLFNNRVKTLMSNPYNVKKAVSESDLVIGAVLVPGAKAPTVVTEDMVKEMQPGSVIVDVAIDQGGCIETCDHASTHDDPIYIKYDVVHYSVANIPGAVPRTATVSLTDSTIPYAVKIANLGVKEAVKRDKALALGVNMINGNLTYKAVADDLDLPYMPIEEALEFIK
ncbi:MAG TPA: alanine dehydrogenase [Thermoanaerobacterales bacterium]|nr:alanine dehydrogenase [Thermoanaerobacterales bacterium]